MRSPWRPSVATSQTLESRDATPSLSATKRSVSQPREGVPECHLLRRARSAPERRLGDGYPALIRGCRFLARPRPNARCGATWTDRVARQITRPPLRPYGRRTSGVARLHDTDTGTRRIDVQVPTIRVIAVADHRD